MPVVWARDVGAGEWIAPTLHGVASDVGAVIPPIFDAYARVFHPLREGPDRRWSDLAARNGRVAHAGMQHHLIALPAGRAPASYEPLRDMDVGTLPIEEVTVLQDVLEPFTGPAAECWFAVWEGFGQLHGAAAHVSLTSAGRVSMPPLVPQDILAGPRLELPGRSYLLLRGQLADAVGITELLDHQSPNLWWPDDRAWFVATEIDFGWTYVGGSAELIDAVVRHPALEAFATTPTEGITYASDFINTALD